MTKHTPTPWILRETDHQCIEIMAKSNREGQLMKLIGEVYGTHYPDILNEEAEANAAFIVQAVNTHEELVNACKSFLDPMTTIEEKVMIAKKTITKAQGGG